MSGGAHPIWEPDDGLLVSPERQERMDILHEISLMEPLERVTVMQYMAYADDLGFPSGKVDIMRRAVAAGLRAAQRERDSSGRLAIVAELRVSKPRTGVHAPVVYYMRSGNLVKIGTTTNIGKRSTSVSPDGVMAIEPGSYDIESTRHGQFRTLWRRGEWFELGPDLAQHIVKVREDFAELIGTSTEDWLALRLPKRRTMKAVREPT